MAENLDAQYGTSRNLDARISLHQRYTPRGSDVWDFVWARYDIAETDNVLEVGSGSGAFWCHHAAKVTNADLTLTDLSDGMLSQCEHNLARTDWRCLFQQANAESLPFEAKRFSVVLAHFMLYHSRDKALALQELRRVVRDDGWVGVVLTAEEHMPEPFRLMLEIDETLVLRPSDADLFHAGNAGGLLAEVFATVEPSHYRYAMAVTDPAPLVTYLQSSPSIQDIGLGEEYWNAYETAVTDSIRRDGSFTVTKGATLFRCRK